MASAIDAARQTIEARIVAQWGATTPIGFLNTSFTPPKTGGWLEPSIIWGDGIASTMGAVGSGGARNTITGLLQMNLFIQSGEGAGLLTRLADTARDMINRLEVSGVRFDVPSGPTIITEEQSAVRVGFTIDELL